MGNDSWNRQQLRKLIERVGRLERVQDTDREIASGPEDWHLEDGALYIYDDDGNLRTRVGKQFDGTYTSRDRNGPVPPQPSKPEVRDRVNGIVAIWDGTFEDEDDAPPLDFRFVAVHASKDPAFVPSFETERAAIVSEDGGQAFVALPAGDPWYIALQTVTTSYKRSVKSLQAAARPQAAYTNYEADDMHLVTAADVTAGTVTFPLSHVPLNESLIAFWGGVPVRPVHYTINYADQTITWPLSGYAKAGDVLWVHYAYVASSQSQPTLDLDTPNTYFVPVTINQFTSTGIGTDGYGETDLTGVGSASISGGTWLGNNSGPTQATPSLPDWVPGCRVFVVGKFEDAHLLAHHTPDMEPNTYVRGSGLGRVNIAVFYSAQLSASHDNGAPTYVTTGGPIAPGAAGIEVFGTDAAVASIITHSKDGTAGVRVGAWGSNTVENEVLHRRWETSVAGIWITYPESGL